MNQPSGIIVKHAADKMKAYVALSGKFGGAASAGMILTELLRHGVSHGLNTSVIHKLIAAGLYDKYVEVAQGTPVKPGRDGVVEVLVTVPRPAVPSIGSVLGGAPDFVIVKAATPVARRVAPVAGINGMDVFGNVMNAPPVRDVKLVTGRGIAPSPDDPDLMLAEYDGVFHQGPDGVISVVPFMEIMCDVDGGSGNVTFDGDVRITGAVRADMVVDVTGSLIVFGEIGEAQVSCGGDLTAFSAIVGGGRGIIDAGGDLRALRIERCALVAGGGVFVEEAVIAADISCKGKMKARSIEGGNIVAAGGVEAVVLGNAVNERTVIDIAPMHGYIKRRESITNCLEVQSSLTEGCVSDLFRFVRDNMDEYGLIADDSIMIMDELIKNLKDSAAVSYDLEKELKELNEALESVVDCSIAATDVYPNVLLKLGFTEQRVKEALKNIHLKPAVVKKTAATEDK